MNIDAESILAISQKAGELIMEVYRQPFAVSYKKDHSPITLADQQAHDYIAQSLAQQTPDIPVLSEESAPGVHQKIANHDCYWLIDPLDGTREFIQRNDEFTVNIALINQKKVVWGCINAPVFKTTWWGGDKQGAWMQSADNTPVAIHVSPPAKAPATTLVLVSRHDQQAEINHPALKLFNKYCFQPMGSSLKFCHLAQGLAHLYVRTNRTYEWDTAAGQAIVEGAGGMVQTLNNQQLTYQKHNYQNPSFWAVHKLASSHKKQFC